MQIGALVRCSIPALFIVFAAAVAAAAQPAGAPAGAPAAAPGGEAPSPPPAAPAPAPAAAPAIPTVATIKNLDPSTPVTQTGGPGAGATINGQLKDRIEIDVAGLGAWRSQPANAQTTLRLYLDSIELPNVVVSLLTPPPPPSPTTTKAPAGAPALVPAAAAAPAPAPAPAAAAPDTTALWVTLEFDNQNSDNRKAWLQVIRAAHRKPVVVSIGPAGGQPFPSQSTLNLSRSDWYSWLVTLFLVVLVLGLVVLARKTNLLRDANNAADPRPYSLARHQMAVWLVVVVWAYLYVWQLTDTAAATSSTALILIGISGATGLAAVTIDGSKRQDAANKKTAAAAEQQALSQSLAPASPVSLSAQFAAAPAGSATAAQLASTIDAKQARLNEVSAQLAQMPIAASSEGWLFDLLSDETGVSFHRLQMMIWTIVLVAVFVKAVWIDVVMPDFDATTLGLMGISSGTYLGFKFPERNP